MYYIYAKFEGDKSLAPMNMEDGVRVTSLNNATKLNREQVAIRLENLMALYPNAEFLVVPEREAA